MDRRVPIHITPEAPGAEPGASDFRDTLVQPIVEEIAG